MAVSGHAHAQMHQDSDEEEGPALSYNWQFHRSSRRWSRVSPPLPVVVTPTGSSSRTPQHLAQQQQQQPLPAAAEAYSSHDSVFLDEPRSSPESRLSTSDERLVGTAADLEGSPGPKLRRSGSERIRDAILRRMDSLRGNRRRRKRGAPQGASLVPSLSNPLSIAGFNQRNAMTLPGDKRTKFGGFPLEPEEHFLRPI